MSAQAKRAFEAFIRSVSGDYIAGAWELLPARIQEAWRAVVVAVVDTEPAPETLTQKQVRLLDEMGTAKLGKLLKEYMPPDRGFILFTVDYGPSGNLAYIATVSREDAIRMLREWLRQKGAP